MRHTAFCHWIGVTMVKLPVVVYLILSTLLESFFSRDKCQYPMNYIKTILFKLSSICKHVLIVIGTWLLYGLVLKVVKWCCRSVGGAVQMGWPGSRWSREWSLMLFLTK